VHHHLIIRCKYELDESKTKCVFGIVMYNVFQLKIYQNDIFSICMLKLSKNFFIKKNNLKNALKRL
jgi:hypothetical protein